MRDKIALTMTMRSLGLFQQFFFFTSSQCCHLIKLGMIKSVNIDQIQVKRTGGYASRSLGLGRHRNWDPSQPIVHISHYHLARTQPQILSLFRSTRGASGG
jgi:hypothetical protein